jgi:hypothetical protein
MAQLVDDYQAYQDHDKRDDRIPEDAKNRVTEIHNRHELTLGY